MTCRLTLTFPFSSELFSMVLSLEPGKSFVAYNEATQCIYDAFVAGNQEITIDAHADITAFDELRILDLALFAKAHRIVIEVQP